jgi:DNA-binding NarL/FixJ family response regulator
LENDRIKVRLLLADDHAEVLLESRNLLLREFNVVATAVNGAALVAAAQEFRPDIVVTDIGMPRLNGIEAARRILDMGLANAIVVLTIHNSPEIVKAALDAGILGYVLKENAGEELSTAIRSALRGEVFLSAGLEPSPGSPNTPRNPR